MSYTTQAALTAEDLITTFYSGILGSLSPSFPYTKMLEAKEQTSSTYIDYIDRVAYCEIVYI